MRHKPLADRLSLRIIIRFVGLLMNAENDDVSSKIRRLCNRRQAGKKINNERGGNRKLEEDKVDKFRDY